MTDWNEPRGENPVAISAKRCPQCNKVVGLQVSECPDCGHLFRTRFQDPLHRTQAFDAVLLPRAAQSSPPSEDDLPGFAGSGGRSRPAHSRHRSSHRSSHRRGRGSPVSEVATFGLAFLGSFSLVALLGVGAWIFLGLGQSKPLPIKRAALTSEQIGLRPGDARDLYGKITLSMPIYDLQQVAGGMGRIIHSSDPHTLILSYDYPEQSVRVSLYRLDPASDDYRVQAVALYHGRHLLNRTSGE